MNDIMKKITKYFCFGIIKCLEFIKRLYIYRFVKIKYLKIERSYLKNRNEDTTLKFLLRSIATLLILLIFVMLFPSQFMYFTGGKTKLELLEFIGWGISGTIAIFGVIGLLQRAAALDKQNEMTEKGHVQERFKTATEHLGNEQVLVRIAAFNEFYHIAEIESSLRKTIFNILCAHLRQTTTHENYQQNTATSKEIKPTEEMQSLLDILFKNDLVFDRMHVNLKGVYLHNADLWYAKLQWTDLQKADLQGAKMWGANLQWSHMKEANLRGANLYQAQLLGTNLEKANLYGANLSMAHLQANLSFANLEKANLYGAYIQSTNLQGANLQGANLQNARIDEDTMMPGGWEDIVEKNKDGETGVLWQ